MKTRPVACAVLLFVLLTVFSPLPASGWQDEGVVEPVPLPVWDSETLVYGLHVYSLGAPALALDPAGRPHVAFGSNVLYHAWFDGADWQRERVAGLRRIESRAVMAIDGAGRIFIVAIDGERAILFTRDLGGLWQSTPLPLPDGVGELSITLEGDGRPIVVAGYGLFQDMSVFYVARQGLSGWSAEAVDTVTPAGGPLQVALDGAGQPVVLYSQADFTELWMARQTAAGWRHERITTGCSIVDKSLAIDAAGHIHIAYSDHCDRHLTYIREGANGWESVKVADDGIFPSLALDAGGRPHIVYKDNEGGQLYAKLDTGYWDVSPVQAGENAGMYNTLVIDEAGTAHVASLNGDLFYATNPAGTWQVSPVARNFRVGNHKAIGLDSNDTPIVLYDIDQAGELWWGTGQGDEWMTGLLADVAVDELEVAVDSQDTPHIAYVDREADRLVAGRRQNETWVLETIGAGGYDLSLAVGSDNRPQITLVTDSGVIYYTRESGEWVSEPVGSLSQSSYGAYLALDKQNRPHIAGMVNGEVLHIVRVAPGQWTEESLAVDNVQGLALGPQEQLYILYRTSEPWKKLPPISIETLWLAVQVDSYTWNDYVVAGGIDWWVIEAKIRVSDDQRAHVAVTDQWGDAVYHWVDPDGTWGHESVGGLSVGDIEIGSDGQPRLLSSDFSNLILSTRRIAWLDQASYLPVAAR